MEFEEFKQEIASAVRQKINATVEIHEVGKTNHVKRIGLCITGKGTCISPLIYLEEYYRDFGSVK